MITINDQDYEIHFSVGRLKLIEEAAKGRPFLSILNGQAGGNMMSISDIELIFALCLRHPGADAYIQRKEAVDICYQLLEQEGYPRVVSYIHGQAMNDLPFLFRVD